MSKEFVAKVRAEGKITIPKEVRTLVNIQKGDLVEVSIKRPEWWEMIDWDEMGKTEWNHLKDEFKNIIRKKGHAPKFDEIGDKMDEKEKQIGFWIDMDDEPRMAFSKKRCIESVEEMISFLENYKSDLKKIGHE